MKPSIGTLAAILALILVACATPASLTEITQQRTETPTPRNVLIVPTSLLPPTPSKTFTPTPKQQKINGISIERVAAFTPTLTPTLTPYDNLPAGCPWGRQEKPVIRWLVMLEQTLSYDDQDKLENVFGYMFYRNKIPNDLCTIIAPPYYAYYMFSEYATRDVHPHLLGPSSLSIYRSLQNYMFHEKTFGKNIDDLWLDLAPLIEKDDAAVALRDPQKYDQEMIESRRSPTDELFSLPLSAGISTLQFNPVLFDRAGLNYPPAAKGQMYIFPDGSQAPWDWDTVAKVARLLTIDIQGHNATQSDFDTNHIEQYGFTLNHWQLVYMPWYWGADTLLVSGGSPGNYTAQIDMWQTGWQWIYDGIHGPQPFIVLNPEDVSATRTHQRSLAFQSGQAAMSLQIWNPSDLANEQLQPFQFAAMPSHQGKIHNPIFTQNFYIFKNSDYRKEAFFSLTYLLEHANPDLVVGSLKTSALYENNIPTRLADRQAYFELQKQKYPWVTTWDAFLTGLVYTDQPDEVYMPNINRVWGRLNDFNQALVIGGIDIAAEEAELQKDLTVIFNEKE